MAEPPKKSPDLETLLSEILESQRRPTLSEKQYEVLKAIDELQRPFQFTSRQREYLKYAWGSDDPHNRRISETKLQQIDHFLDLSERELDSWMHRHGPLMRLKERKKKAGAVRKQSSDLQDAFRALVATEESHLALESYVAIRLMEERYEDAAINRALELIDRPSVFALIPPLLKLLEDAAHRLEEATNAKPGKDRRAYKHLVRRLAGAFEIAFRKGPPSANERGNFVRYIDRLQDLKILRQPVGVELIRNTLKERRKA